MRIPLAQIHFFEISLKFVAFEACVTMLIAPQSMPANCETFLDRSATRSFTKNPKLVKKWISARGLGADLSIIKNLNLLSRIKTTILDIIKNQILDISRFEHLKKLFCWLLLVLLLWVVQQTPYCFIFEQ